MKELLGQHTCVIRTESGEILTSDARGILPPLGWLRENPVLLHGAEVADKIVGKAAALLFAFGGVKCIWAEHMSEAAITYLEHAGIPFEYAERVAQVMNRDGTDMCPMERRALAIDDPAEAFMMYDSLIPK